MHRLTTPDGSSRQSMFLRWGRTVSYLLMAAAGALMLLSEHIALAYGSLGVVMAGFLLAGGSISALGSATSRWAGEYRSLDYNPDIGERPGVITDQMILAAVQAVRDSA